MADILHFIEGFRRFKNEEHAHKLELFQNLADYGQSPKVMMLTCADSRISVSTLTYAEPGELFIVRNVGNLVPKHQEGELHLSTTAAFEFAVLQLKVEDIVVMGHSHCGGIKALMQSAQQTAEDCNITKWVMNYHNTRDTILEKHKDNSFEHQCFECEKLAVVQSIRNLYEYPWIKERIDRGELSLHPWYYDLGEVDLFEIDEESLELRSLL